MLCADIEADPELIPTSSLNFSKCLGNLDNMKVHNYAKVLLLRAYLQSFTGYLRQTRAFTCEIALYRKSSISVFREAFTSTEKIFISGEGLTIRPFFYNPKILSLE